MRFSLSLAPFVSVQEALHAFECPELLNHIYGEGNHMFSPLEKNKRTGLIRGIQIPTIIRPFADGDTASARIVEQRKIHDNGEVEIHARVKPAIVGAEFVRCKTIITFVPPAPPVDHVTMRVRVDTRVLLPPIIAGITRDFVHMMSTKSLRALAALMIETSPRV